MAAGHSVYDMLGVPHDWISVAGAAVAGAVVIGGGVIVRSKLKNQEENLLPAPKFSLFNSAVELVKIFRNLLHGMIGPHADAYLPIVLSTFLFILIANLSGLVPGFLPPTENINNNFAMAIFVFLAYQFFGLKEHGVHYFKQFTGGLPGPGYGLLMTLVLAMIAALIFVIETLGHIVRPFSLSLRLWGTISGDHALVGVLNSLVPLFIPILAMGLGLLVSVVQALVFALLSTVYIKLAVSHDH